ncbi:Proteasome subunit beta type-2 [Trichinella pseudospiralis]|uniref:Proteasome subunit beta type-2 n=2 Tax=Trichinella pseudospiralis TaxID=6337 RepID=A0A0V1FJC7_TRIPS|nr:Proteasome subunit beta type-2 [Trichinella pseudospiralis]KRY86122.1 Proteasome subunit beta type-2 [Trichinella pseudospiralis]KRZ19540.1 Proteasome subunit beta type-2 [Trichinella pseudospiralis]KRZ41937.1 Proteasome subunit beta type-2 [Trichinella pseudospiralis]
MLNYLFGMKTKEFVLIAADTMSIQQVWMMTETDNKFYLPTDSCAMVVLGDGGEADVFGEYVERNMHLYNFRHGFNLSPKNIAAFARKTIIDNLRTATPHLVNMILAGYDEQEGPYLSMIDYLGTQFTGPYLMFGYGSFFTYSILDRIYNENFTFEEAMDALKACFQEVRKRLIVDVKALQVKIIDKNGIRDLENIVL